MDSRVRNHASVQDCSSFGNSPFKSKFYCLGFGTSLLFRKNLSYPFLFDRILYHSRLPVCLHVCELLTICLVHWAAHLSPSIRPTANLSRNSGIFGTKITQSKVKALVSESGNFFPVKTADFQKLPLTNSRSPDYNISDSEYYGQAAA